MPTLSTEQIVVFGQTIKIKRSDAVKNRASIDALRRRLLRVDNERRISLFVFEESAPPSPYFDDGVQKGWTPQPSKYRLYEVDASLASCIELAIVLGFRPASCPQHAEELRDSLSTLVTALDSHDHLSLTEASPSFLILEIARGHSLPNSDAKQVLDFNLHELGAKLQEVNYAAYAQHFVERGCVVIGTSL